MPFKKITHGKDAGNYKSPSGKVYTWKQIKLYYASKGFTDKKMLARLRKESQLSDKLPLWKEIARQLRKGEQSSVVIRHSSVEKEYKKAPTKVVIRHSSVEKEYKKAPILPSKDIDKPLFKKVESRQSKVVSQKEKEPEPKKEEEPKKETQHLKLKTKHLIYSEYCEGNECSIETQTEEINAKYALTDLFLLVPSNDPTTFAWNPKYPKLCQTRDYYGDKAEQERVTEYAEHFKPRNLINDAPVATTGPPIITPDGVVLGGNKRTMVLYKVEQFGKYKDYVNYLKKRIKNFGFSNEDLDEFKAPVLVRVVDIDMNKCATYSNILNADLRQEMSKITETVALAQQLDEKTYRRLAAIFEQSEGETLSEILNDTQDRQEVINILKKAGIITSQNTSKWLSGMTNNFTDDGKRNLEAILLGGILPDANLIEAMPSSPQKNYRAKIIKTVPYFIQMKSLSKEYDLNKNLIEVVKEYAKKKDTKAPVRQYLRQENMEGSRISEKTKSLWLALDELNQAKFKEFIQSYTKTATNESEGDAFGGKPATAEEIMKKLLANRGLEDKSKVNSRKSSVNSRKSSVKAKTLADAEELEFDRVVENREGDVTHYYFPYYKNKKVKGIFISHHFARHAERLIDKIESPYFVISHLGVKSFKDLEEAKKYLSNFLYKIKFKFSLSPELEKQWDEYIKEKKVKKYEQAALFDNRLADAEELSWNDFQDEIYELAKINDVYKELGKLNEENGYQKTYEDYILEFKPNSRQVYFVCGSLFSKDSYVYKSKLPAGINLKRAARQPENTKQSALFDKSKGKTMKKHRKGLHDASETAADIEKGSLRDKKGQYARLADAKETASNIENGGLRDPRHKVFIAHWHKDGGPYYHRTFAIKKDASELLHNKAKEGYLTEMKVQEYQHDRHGSIKSLSDAKETASNIEKGSLRDANETAADIEKGSLRDVCDPDDAECLKGLADKRKRRRHRKGLSDKKSFWSDIKSRFSFENDKFLQALKIV
jgi:hypothetical protein